MSDASSQENQSERRCHRILAGSLRGAVNGTGASASFAFSYGVAADAGGNVYVADSGNNLRTITLSGLVSTLAGSGAQGAVNGTGAAASFLEPYSVAVDANDTVDGGLPQLPLAPDHADALIFGPKTAGAIIAPAGVRLVPAGERPVAPSWPNASLQPRVKGPVLARERPRAPTRACPAI